jgi:hypothetical protein
MACHCRTFGRPLHTDDARVSHRNLISFHLVPSPERRAQIAQDYRGMVDMFMATPPSFNSILQVLGDAEKRINAATPAT